MQRAVKCLEPFPFRADFSVEPPAPASPGPEPERFTLSGEELAVLVSKVRSETIADAAREKARGETEALSRLAGELSGVLGELVQLLGTVEAVQYTEKVEAALRTRIEAAAGRIVRGQGDLFDALDKAAKAQALTSIDV